MKQRAINPDDFGRLTTLPDKIKFCLQYAVLAPSVHNTQPWVFKITKNSCQLYFDPKLALPYADPTGRNLYLSLGKCLENLILAGKVFGILTEVKYVLRDNFVAEVFFKNEATPNHSLAYLLDAIVKRVNSRGPFLPHKVEARLIQGLKELFERNYADDNLRLDLIQDGEIIKKIAELTAQGMEIAHSNKGFRKEMAHWLQNDLSPRKTGMPGFSLRMPFMLSFIIPTAVRFFNLGKFLGRKNYESVSSAPLICMFSAKKVSPEVWVKIGIAIERLSLELQSTGYKTSVYIASVEMGDLYKQVQEVVGTGEFIPQFLFCAGAMENTQKLTPKLSVEEKLMN